jgi:hypothetical protein
MSQFDEYDIFCDARRKMNYYKGEILPFVHKVCRKDMTSGDIDGFVWDFNKKIYIVIEQKWTNEKQKSSQIYHLKFLSTIFAEMKSVDRFAEYKFYVFKIVGDPPFNECVVYDIGSGVSRKINRQQLKDLLEMTILFEDIT